MSESKIARLHKGLTDKEFSCKELTEKYIAAIEKLQATYDGVKPTLEAALAKVSAFSGEIASITPSPAYSYVA